MGMSLPPDPAQQQQQTQTLPQARPQNGGLSVARPMGAMRPAGAGLWNRQRRNPQQGQPPVQGQPPQGQGQAPQSLPQQQHMTFAQMQANGMARPAPPPPPPSLNTIQGQMQGAASQALATPSRYDTQSFNTIRDSATNDLQHQYDLQREQLDENLARRGLSASTFGANNLHDLGAAQSRDMATLNSQLLQQAANTQASDRQQAFGMGQGLLQQQLAQTLGLGNLGISQGQLTGNYGGQSTLGAQQLAQQGSQFQQSQAQQAHQFDLQQQLAQTLGLGNLGLQQGELTGQYNGQSTLGAQQLANQQHQFDVSQALQSQLGLGGLDLQKQQLAQQGSQFGQNLDLQKAQLAQQGSQFGQGLTEQQRQFNLQNALQSQLGLGNLDLQNRQLSQQGSQFTASQAQQQQQFNTQQALADASKAGRTVTEIAYAWGFCDLTHFGRSFKRAYGISPGRWRDIRLASPGSAP